MFVNPVNQQIEQKRSLLSLISWFKESPWVNDNSSLGRFDDVSKFLTEMYSLPLKPRKTKYPQFPDRSTKEIQILLSFSTIWSSWTYSLSRKAWNARYFNDDPERIFSSSLNIETPDGG
jgi:hypothetical protein